MNTNIGMIQNLQHNLSINNINKMTTPQVNLNQGLTQNQNSGGAYHKKIPNQPNQLNQVNASEKKIQNEGLKTNLNNNNLKIVVFYTLLT